MSESLRLIKTRLLKTAHVQRQRQKSNEQRQRGWNRVLALTLLIGGIGYLIQVNMIATAGYTIKDFEKKIAVYEKENELIRMSLFESQKLEALQQKAKELGLVRSDTIQYLAQKDESVAAR